MINTPFGRENTIRARVSSPAVVIFAPLSGLVGESMLAQPLDRRTRLRVDAADRCVGWKGKALLLIRPIL
jgi:hypothetical protein